MKKCTICQIEKDENKGEFGKDKTRLDGYDCSCKQCKKERKYKEYWNDPQKYLAKVKIYDAKRYGTEEHREYQREYAAKNRDKKRKYIMDYKATKLQATPPWLTPQHHVQILDFYTKAIELTQSTQQPHEVDHIIPLNPRSKTVCGLHVPWNLQVISKTDNVKKSDSY